MPRPKNQFPSYLYHKKSGQARVRLKVDGRYRETGQERTGKPGTKESKKPVNAWSSISVQPVGSIMKQNMSCSPA